MSVVRPPLGILASFRPQNITYTMCLHYFAFKIVLREVNGGLGSERNAWSESARRVGLLLLVSDYGELNVQKSGRDESVSRLLQLRREC